MAYTYLIKRETLIPWDNSTASFTHQGGVYDVVESAKDTGLESVSDYILEQNTIVKCPINESKDSKNELFNTFENTTGRRVHELLLG